MEGWNRKMWYDETGLGWIPPSPNMRTESTATVYPGTCLFEATNVSEGRGTEKPFEYIGAPWIDGEKLSAELASLKLDSVSFVPVKFTPRGDSIAAPNPKYNNQKCGGVYVRVRNRASFKPVETGLMMLGVIKNLYPDSLRVRNDMMDRLSGSSAVRKAINSGTPMRDIMKTAGQELGHFLLVRSKYLLYE